VLVRKLIFFATTPFYPFFCFVCFYCPSFEALVHVSQKISHFGSLQSIHKVLKPSNIKF